MVPFFPVSNNEALAPMEGNPFRDVWKAACWKMSQEVYSFYSWFSHDITKIQRIIDFPEFYFHEVLEQLKTYIFQISTWKGFFAF